MNVSRRSLLVGLGAGLVCAPAIVRASSLMKVKAIKPTTYYFGQYEIYDDKFKAVRWSGEWQANGHGMLVNKAWRDREVSYEELCIAIRAA